MTSYEVSCANLSDDMHGRETATVGCRVATAPSRVAGRVTAVPFCQPRHTYTGRAGNPRKAGDSVKIAGVIPDVTQKASEHGFATDMPF